jgi:hypothetical protein
MADASAATGGFIMGSGGTTSTGGTGGTGLVIDVPGTGGTVGAAGASCEGFVDQGWGGVNDSLCWSEYDYIVGLPAEGVPGEPGEICSVVTDPVSSNCAARAKLTMNPDWMGAQGFVELDPSLEVVGIPMLEVIDATEPGLTNMQFSTVTKQAGGFSFQASWQSQFYPTPGYSRITVRITLEVSCGPDAGTQIVHAATDIHLCHGEDYGAEWVSSGDRCVVCRVIAEMAPSPIVPDKKADNLPLARALRLRIVELARVSNRVVLLAENDGGEGLDYDWHASSGQVVRLAPDVVLWTLEEGMADPMIQAAVSDENSAAVASFAFNEAA